MDKSQHTVGHVDCPACAALSVDAIDPQHLQTMNLPDAAAAYRRAEDMFLSPRTRKDYEQYFAKLIEFFGDQLKLRDYTIGHVRSYQRWRSEHAGARRTNYEMAAFARLMREAGLWKSVEAYYKPLPVPHLTPGKALSQDEARHLFRVAAKNSRSKVALLAGLLSSHSGAGPGELRHLQLGDINLAKREFSINRGTKNKFRVRTRHLDDTGFAAMKMLLKRAREKGSVEPTHFLLPARKKGGGFDPAKPQDNWYKSWRGMCKAAGFPGLRPYDMRHTFATWVLANPNVSIETVVEMMGWVDPQMIKTYSHQRNEQKRAAVEALDQIDIFSPTKKKPEPVNMLEGIDVQTKVQ